MNRIAARLEQLTSQLRAEQQSTTTSVLEQALSAPTGNVRAVAVDAHRGSILLVIDDLVVRAAIGRPAQAQEIQLMHRAAPTELLSGTVLDDGRVLLAFTDGEQTVPLVAEGLTRVAS